MKKYFRALPFAVLAAVILFALVGLFVFGAYRANQTTSEATSQKQVAIVTHEDDDFYMEMALSLLENMESLEGRLSFVTMDFDTAHRAMEKREVMAIIEVPEGAIDDIMNCDNAQINVLFPGDKDVSAIFLTEFTRAGGRLLTTAQAGTMTAGKLLHNLNLPVSDVYYTIDMMNFSYVLSRLDVYDNKHDKIAIDYLSYYLASGFVLILLFMGFGLMPALALDSPEISRMKAAKGITPVHTYLIRVINLTLVMLLFSLLITILFGSLYNILQGTKQIFLPRTGSAYIYIVLVALFLSVYNQVIIYSQNDGGRSILLLFLTGILLSFVSGNILPIAFFPEKIRPFGKVLPTAYMQQDFIQIFTGQTPGAQKELLFYVLVLFIVGLCLALYKHHKEVH